MNCTSEILYRELLPQDIPALERLIRTTWQYDRFCSADTAGRLAAAYLGSCLASHTFSIVAEQDGSPIGVILGRNARIHRRSWALRRRALQTSVRLLASAEGRRVCRIFGCVQKIDRQLLKAAHRDYAGEVALFAVSPECRGRGVGRRLFTLLKQEMLRQGVRDLFLFTDTSCNYGFYEHQGMTRRCEKHHIFSIGGQRAAMRFFLYDLPLTGAGGVQAARSR